MSFVAVNADALDSQVALQQNLQYNESKAEFENVLDLCREDVEMAWRRLSALLDGELFSMGLAIQPNMKELQKSCLALALDVARRVEPSGLIGLALETVEWFPEEAIFWATLADALQGDFKETVAKRLALKKYVQLAPFDRKRRAEFNECTLAIGRTEALVPSQTRFYPKVAFEPVPTVKVVLLNGSKLSQIISLICDAAEDVLGMSSTKRHRGQQHEYKLSTIINIVIDGASTETSTIQDETLQLSQAGSIRNFHDYSSQVSTRSQSRRLRKESIATETKKLTLKDLTLKIQSIISTLNSDPIIDQLTKEANSLYESSIVKSNVLSMNYSSSSGVDPIISDFSWIPFPSITLDSILKRIVDFVTENHSNITWNVDLSCSMHRLSTVLCNQYEHFADYISISSLLWLIESLHFANQKNDELSLEYLLIRLERFLVSSNHHPKVDKSHVIRYLWMEYCTKSNVKILDLMEIILNEISCDSVLVMGSMNGTSCVSITKDLIDLERDRLSQTDKLEEARKFLQGDGNTLWLENNIKDPITWLVSNICTKEFLDLTLLVFDASKDDHVRMTLLLLGIFKCLECNEDITRFVKLLSIYPKVFVSLSHTTKLLEPIFEQSSIHEIILFVLSLLEYYKLDDENIDLLLLLWRDMVLVEKIHTKDDRFLSSMKSLLKKSDDLMKEDYHPHHYRQRETLEYCVLRCIGGSPFLDITDDFDLVKSIGNDHLKDSHLSSPDACRLFILTEKLCDLEGLDDQKIASFVDFICSHLLPEIPLLPGFISARKRLELFLKRTTNVTYEPFSFVNRTFLKAELAQVLSRALSLKGLSMKKLLVSKRRSVEQIQLLYEEMINRIVIEEDNEEMVELFWNLGCLYDAELHLWMAKDASTLVENSIRIHRLVYGVYNAWNHSIIEEKEEEEYDSMRLYKIIQLTMSMASGGLSLFIDNHDTKPLGRSLMRIVKKYQSISDWKLVYAKAIASGLLQQNPRITIVLRLQSLSAFLKSDSASTEYLYQQLHGTLAGFFELYQIDPELITTKLFEPFMEVIKSRGIFQLDDDNEEEGGVVTVLDRLKQFTSQLDKVDKKRSHHFHSHTLALHCCKGTFSLTAVKTFWSKLVPPLIKPKSQQLVTVWQTESDYPGDYLLYADQYIREAADALLECKGDLIERASLVATLIGRIANAPNLFVKQKKLMRHLLTRLLGIVQQVDQQSLGEFERSKDLEEIYEDAIELTESHNVFLDPMDR